MYGREEGAPDAGSRLAGRPRAARSDLDPDAKWRAVEDGPWDCENRATILEVMKRNVADRFGGRIENVVELGDRVIVAFRPDHHGPDAWPLDEGIRYMVVTMQDGLVTEMKGYANRRVALVSGIASRA